MKKAYYKKIAYFILISSVIVPFALSEENDGLTYFRHLDDPSPIEYEKQAPTMGERFSNFKSKFIRNSKMVNYNPFEDENNDVTSGELVTERKGKADNNKQVVKDGQDSKITGAKNSSKSLNKLDMQKSKDFSTNVVSEQKGQNPKEIKKISETQPEENLFKTVSNKLLKKRHEQTSEVISKENSVQNKQIVKSKEKEPKFIKQTESEEKIVKEVKKNTVDSQSTDLIDGNNSNAQKGPNTEDPTKELFNINSYNATASKEETNNTKKKRLLDHFRKDKKVEPVVNNKLYLDRFKAENQADTNAYYKERNLIVKPNGEVELILQSDDEKGIDTLINEIEATSPDDTFTPPIKLSLRDSIGIAIAKHPSVKSAIISADIYKARIIAAWAPYFPTFSAGFDFSHNYSKTRHYESYKSNSGTIPTVSAGLLIFDFGKAKTDADIAKVDYSASKYDIQDTINELIYDVKTAYYNVLFAQHQVDVYNKMIEEFDLQVRSAKKFFSIGKKAEIDVITAEFNAGNARLNLVKAVNTLENAKVAFSNTLGLPEFANYTLSDELPRIEYKTDLEMLLQDAFYIRPDLISAEKSLENAKLSVRKARRAFAPDITANGTTGYSRTDSIGTTSYGISANMNYSINYLQLKKGLDVAKLSYEKAQADYELKKQRVYLEVKQAYINLNNSLNSVYQADENLKSAKAQSYHSTGRYNAGLSTAIELKDSENTYMNSQLEYYNALLNYNTTVAELEKVVGKPIASVINKGNANTVPKAESPKDQSKTDNKKSEEI